MTGPGYVRLLRLAQDEGLAVAVRTCGDCPEVHAVMLYDDRVLVRALESPWHAIPIGNSAAMIRQ